ncbi:MAG: hypothetical protein EAY72_11640, partial [Bacteroidetes bacterium]
MKMHCLRLLPAFLLLCFLHGSTYVFAQLNIKNFSKANYGGGTQNWAFEADKDGRVFVANNEGVLVFTGNKWTVYPLPNNTIVRSMAMAADGRLYVGGQDEVGFFTANAAGKLKYQSLVPLIPKNQRQFADVWNIVIHNNEVYFRSFSTLFILKNNAITCHSTNTQWYFLGKHQGKVVVHERGKQPRFWQNGSIATTNFDSTTLITSTTPFNSSSLVTTSNNGLFLLTNNQLVRFSLQGLPNASGMHFTHAKQLQSGQLLLGTYENGLVQADSAGNVQGVITTAKGLNSNNVKYIFEDKQANIWLGLEEGISVMDVRYPITWVNAAVFNGAGGYSATVANNFLYFSLANGIYKAPLGTNQSFTYRADAIEKIAGGLSWRVATIDNQLLAGTDDGCFTIQNNGLKAIDKSTGYWIFKEAGNQTVVAGNYNGIALLKKTSTGYEKLWDWNALQVSARYVEVDTVENLVWISHPYRGVYQISLTTKKVEQFTQQNGLPSNLNNHV